MPAYPIPAVINAEIVFFVWIISSQPNRKPANSMILSIPIFILSFRDVSPEHQAGIYGTHQDPCESFPDFFKAVEYKFLDLASNRTHETPNIA